MRRGEGRERLLARGGEGKKDPSSVVRVLSADQITPTRQPINESDRAVAADTQPLRQIADGHLPTARVSLDCEQRLVLARCEARRMSRLLAEKRVNR